ncbi:hypothetical protein DMUE_1762 [Dictyocoela muelleri]|nr:hypothetical protein DMUE_1762 [Dictyocoela muelleri]
MFSIFLYNRLKNNVLTPEIVIEIYKELKIIKCRDCRICRNPLTIQKDMSKSSFVRYFCSCCKKYTELRIYTPFSQFRAKIIDILRVICLFSESFSNIKIMEELDLSKPTISKIITQIRISIHRYTENLMNSLTLGGQVEVDETLLARRKYERGRLVEQQWLFGAIERYGGHFLLKTVDKRDASTLGQVIRDWISEDATVYSDQWKAYEKIFRESEIEYNHQTVNHSENFINPENADVHTQNIESLWSSLKRFLRSRNLNNRERISHYISEFTFRKYHKNKTPKDLFLILVRLIFEVQ